MITTIPTTPLDHAALVELAKRRREDRLYPKIENPRELAHDLALIRDLERLIISMENTPYDQC